MFEELRKLIEESNNIVFFGGAGVSTESNIPDFRSENGLYNAKQKYNHSPEEMLSGPFLNRFPAIFFEYYRNNLLYPEALPNPAHFALARLEKQGKLKAVITQNVDGLHQRAGSNNVIELHGTGMNNYCLNCGAEYGFDFIAKTEGIPKCTRCGGMVRPDIVLYSENLNYGTIMEAVEALQKADLCIVGGTSLVVQPAAGLLSSFRGDNLVLINRDATPYDSRARLIIRDSIGKVLSAVVPE